MDFLLLSKTLGNQGFDLLKDISLSYKPFSVNILRKVRTACVYMVTEKGNVNSANDKNNNCNGNK